MKSSSILFIAGSRELSAKRILTLFKRYSPKFKIVWGIYTEPFILEFENQPQFRTLKKETLEKFKSILESKSPNLTKDFQIYEYSQNDETEFIKNLNPEKVIFINASWKIAFHRRPLFEFLQKENIEFSLKSPFDDEIEAKDFSGKIVSEVQEFVSNQISNIEKSNSNNYFLKVADTLSKLSFDYTWQTGAVLEKNGKIIIQGHNKVLPYETYTFHHGSLKEHGLGKFSKAHMNDLNVNDTLHAEMDIVSQALQNNIDIEGSTLYVNLMPCPNCARMLATTGISKVVCRKQHFGGFAEELFKSMGIKVEVQA